MSNEKNKFLFPYKQFVTNSTYDNKFFDIDIESYKGKLNIINFDKILESRYQKNTLSKALSNIFKIMMVSSLFGGSVIYSNQLKAGAVRDDVPYQTFKDFGSNKGVFQPGAVNIPIFNKDGVQIGILDQAPMPDFSSVDVKQKIATLIAPGYVASVKHNTGYKNVRFGSASDALYTLVDRNNHGSIDYHTPRLDKIVTEVAPVEYTNVTKDGVSAEKSEVFLDSVRYPVMYRVGTGTSKILDADNNTQLVDRGGNPSNIPLSYDHITGGTIRLPTEIKTNGLHLFSETKDSHSQNANKKHPLTNNVWEGDSGSPLFAYDTVEKKWIVLGYSALITVGKITGKQQSHWWLFPDYDFTEEKISEDTAPEIQLRGTEEAAWRSTDTNGGAEISQNNTDFSAQGKSSNTNQTVALNDGKNLIITNLDDVQSTIVLENNIHQGAGSITFKTDAIVKSNNDSNWQGAGIIVEKDKSVEWKIDGVEGDALHRLGEGTLIVNGTGVNKGDLNTGDGVTILAQQADEHGNVQAFNSVRIVSGRSKVVLADSKQVNADNILWGFRGGELDVNGNDLIFNRIRATDYGAILNNSSSQTANITFNSDKKNYIFHGKIEGNIDLFNEAPLAYEDQNFILDGSLELENNQFTKENGALVFQGHAISHAIGSDKKATYLTQEDWEDRSFKLKQLNLINTDFTLGRNATLTGNISSQNSIIKIGSDNAFVDTNDGDNVDYTESLNAAGIAKDIQKVVGGLSLNGERSSQYYGIMDLDNSQAIVNDYWNGGVIATDSQIELVQGQQVWNKDSQLTGSSLDIQSAQLTVEDKLKLNASQLNLSDKGELIGDIQAKADSHIQLGDGTDATAQYQGQIALENSQLQVKQNWEGGVQATDSKIELVQGQQVWNKDSQLTGSSLDIQSAQLTVADGLKLNQSDLQLSDKGELIGDIQAKADSHIQLGDGTDATAQYQGQIALENSQLQVKQNWEGGVQATDSKIELVQGQQVWNKDSQLTGSSLDIQSAQLTVADGLKLNQSDLQLSDKGELIGDIQAKADSHIQLGGGTDATAQYQGQIALENSQLQVKQNWEGGVQATDSKIELVQGQQVWNKDSQLTGSSLDIQSAQLTVADGLKLNQSDLQLSDKGELIGDIQAKADSHIQLGGGTDATAQYQGQIALENSQLQVKQNWEGGVQATDSKIELVQGQQVWNKDSQLTGSSLDIQSAQLTVEDKLKLNASQLNLSDKGELIGDIQAKADSHIQLGDGTDATAQYQGQIALENSQLQVKQNWEGGVQATDSKIELVQGQQVWNKDSQLTGSSLDIQSAQLTVEDKLKLNASQLNLSDKGELIGNIQAKADSYIQLGDGTEATASYQGQIALENSQLQVKQNWEGGVQATDSKIELVQGQQVWNKDSQLTGSSLDIQSAQLTVADGLKLNQSDLQLSDKGELIGDIQAKADSHIQLGDGTEATASYQGQIALENSQLQVKQNWEGGVQATDSSIEMLGGVHQWNAASILENTTVKMNQTDLTVRSNLNGIFQLNSAVLNLMNDINANKKYTIDSVDLNDSTLNVDSDINGSISKLNSFNSSVSFKINNNSPAHFSILNVDEFNVNNTYFSLNTDTINSDKIIINHKAEGSGNQLDISLLRDKNIDIHKDYDVLLVSAPLDTKDDVFNAVPVLHGFSELKPELKKQIINNNKEWRLSQVVASENKKATSMANHFLNSDYGLFIHNLGNLDQRFGDLRESQEHSLGVWGRVKTGKGEFLSEVTDKYTQYQLGFDQQLDAKNGTLIAGLVGIMTQGDTTSSNYKINSKSYAAGLYGTYLSDKGAYIDVLGQYVQHRNDYSLNYLGVNKTKADYHSIQLETEVGYRFHPTDRFYIEPQAKLAYANVSGKDFNWVNQQDISMSMSTPSYNLLVSRAGLHIGKFIDTDKANWQIHMGVDYEKDLINTQENRLSDRISTYYSEPEKDDRTLVSFGGSVKIKDRLTAGLDVERSFGGRYDIKNALNFNLKYTFK